MVLLTAFTSNFCFDTSSTEWFSAVFLKLQSFLVHWVYFVCSLPFSFHQFRNCSYLAGLWKVQGAARSGAELKQGDVAVSSWGDQIGEGKPRLWGTAFSQWGLWPVSERGGSAAAGSCSFLVFLSSTRTPLHLAGDFPSSAMSGPDPATSLQLCAVNFPPPNGNPP